ncbi:bacteriohopanetetrol glucosamine biosynthesis glycosyltransferase HpnI [Sphingomonas morindae]|uniref:Bacteriohopanetetrol glucosamine biosynthesis glycosyltransferase HpnI n=1 Tax=Sphingomonas morindae TaxID=1541170 RepID=A0ABY4X435_9SPHN|nr:bacteriohopanetetrol glucosamine biosynthesis glycosyltransferase HpnI [Sphingomonas morindae]USI71662.1 bacteriohopanetetrol glucosamine biosynthesis glycosyltransferase HpnI [Sphingomonas morindae]
MSLMAAAATLLAGVAILYTLAAAALAGRWRAPPPAEGAAPSITLLKPLHGPEPGLEAKLASFLDQDYAGPVEMICGVARADDPALAAARAVGATLVVDPRRHGANGKVSNLINMAEAAQGAVIVLSDDDMEAPRDYLRRLVAALAAPGTGAVTCLYAGRGDAGGWSRLAAAGISWQFLPNVMIGLATGLAKPCMGSTIALSAETLARIGGFARVKDLLADDHAIGAAVRALGLEVAVPPMILTHGCSESSLSALIAHELRWAATVRLLDPWGYAGSLVTWPLPLALIAIMAGAPTYLALAALAARLVLALRIDRLAGRRTAPLWTLPLRDLLGFALFVASWFVRRVDWRGETLRLSEDGRVSAETETA